MTESTYQPVFGKFLVVDGQDHNYSTIDITKNQKITIGRANSSTIIIDDPAVSGTHCVIWTIQFDDDSVPLIYIKDISLNGTYINNKRMAKKEVYLLCHGDIISIRHGINLEYYSAFEECENEFGRMILERNEIKTDFDNWKINERVLGNGTFGHVFVSHRKNDSRLYAVKVVQNPAKDIPFEAKILLKLDHPNIIKVHETLLLDGKLYIFEDLVCGGDLFSYLAKGNSLAAIPEFEALVITFQILGALRYLHRNNVVHRDLKLDNILLEFPKPFTRVVLADFGIAKSICSTKRRMFTTVGTPEYCAPEVGFEFTKIPAHSKNEIITQVPPFRRGYDSKCDLWSLGVIVHIMLSGISPFYEDGSEINIIKSAKKGKLKFHMKQWQSVSEAAIDFVQGLLCVDMKRRMDIGEASSHKWVLKHESELITVYQKILDTSIS